jgi:hypothetical protein
MTPVNKTIVAAVFAAATAALVAVPTPPTWAVIIAAALTPVSVFFVPNKSSSSATAGRSTPGAHGRHGNPQPPVVPPLAVPPKATPGVPLTEHTTSDDERLG